MLSLNASISGGSIDAIGFKGCGAKCGGYGALIEPGGPGDI